MGTVPVAMTLILIIFISSWQVGMITAIVFLIASLVERGVKLIIDRKRPFETLPKVNMIQPKAPNDPSHPSGDAMRVWFLALIFPLAFSLNWLVFTITIFFAIILSLGRIILGVHYPLDVIGGSGLGLISTGFTVLSCYFILVN
jgi:undecaprenyl-diphosphatase